MHYPPVNKETHREKQLEPSWGSRLRKKTFITIKGSQQTANVNPTRAKTLAAFTSVEMFTDNLFDICRGSLIGCELFTILAFVSDISIIHFT